MVNDELTSLLAPIAKAEDLGVPLGMIQDIVFRLLYNEGEVSVARFAEVLGLHVQVLDDVLSRLKHEHLVHITKAGSLGSISFTYSLTEEGIKRARNALARSQYIGLTPVPLESYNRAILAQAKGGRRISAASIQRSLSHLILPENFHRQIGPAVNAGSSIFLYGPPGNGKTTIAQAIAKVLSSDDPIWLPEAIAVGGQIIRVFDPLVHEPIPENQIMLHAANLGGTTNISTDKLKIDRRWRLFKRPAVMVGGELTMDSLDLRFEPVSKVYEAPLQLKANGGMFLIDDFGRQQISPQELLNRWIVPLESSIDFLRLESGQTLEVPFEQFIVFSTNLDPMDLVDDAFLRRIQMKVEVGGPDEKLFYKIFLGACETYNVPFDRQTFVHLIHKWYRQTGRAMQSVHPRDLIRIIVSISDYDNQPPRMTPTLIDEACDSYFVDKTATPKWATAARGVNGSGNGNGSATAEATAMATAVTPGQ